MLAVPQNPYTVALVDAQGLPFDERVKAEGRFAAALERSLGGADVVVATYKAWLEADEAEILTAELTARVARWFRVAQEAQSEGMRTLGDIGSEAHFEIRLPRDVHA